WACEIEAGHRARERAQRRPCAAVAFVVTRIETHHHDEYEIAPDLEQQPVQKSVMFVEAEHFPHHGNAGFREAGMGENFINGKLGRLGSGGSLHAHSLSASKPGKSAAASRRGSPPADVGRGSWCPPRCVQAITAARDSTTRLPVPVCMRTLRRRRPRPSTIPVAARVYCSLLADRVVLRPNDRTLCVPE